MIKPSPGSKILPAPLSHAAIAPTSRNKTTTALNAEITKIIFNNKFIVNLTYLSKDICPFILNKQNYILRRTQKNSKLIQSKNGG